MAGLRVLALPLALALSTVFGTACRREVPPPPPPTTESPINAPADERVVGPLSPDDAQALATMNDRIKDYVALHDKIEATLPKRSTDATPQEIDKVQREFEAEMRKARTGAKQGDIFTPDAQPVILRLLATVFGGPGGAQMKASIMDENTVDAETLHLTVNSRYPDSVPLTSVPPGVLQTMPQLPEDLEYRFVGDWLILLDTHAHVIADYIKHALPK